MHAQPRIEQSGRIDERIAVHDPIPREFGTLKTGYHTKDALLFGKCEIRLESDQVIALPIDPFSTQLHHCPRTATSARIAQPDRFERPEAWRVESFSRDLLVGQTS